MLDSPRQQTPGNKPPLINVLGDLNLRDIVWSDRFNKSGSSLSQTEGQILIDIMNDHGLEQLDNFPTRERNTLDLILTSLPGQFVDIHSPDKLSDHDIVSGTLKMVKIAIPPKKKPRRKVYRYQKGDYKSMRAETLKFAKERYFLLPKDQTIIFYSMVTQILGRSRKISISLLRLFRNRQINISPQKLVVQFPLSVG